MEEEKQEAVTVPVKKENENKKKWMKRIWGIDLSFHFSPIH
jgi:hypothetical protein